MAQLELIPKDIIRIETALSRFPLHRLAKQGNISIEIKDTNPNGHLKTKWEVDYSNKHGQPGPLAYKLDSLIVNRKIEEAGKPVPKMIKLGSLRDICRELGVSEGKNKENVKKALYQNASSFITAKISYKQINGTEQTMEAAFSRYSIVLTGEKLPNGTKADAVYLILNDIYLQILNTAQTRPLDYDYLKELAPAPQRFYELLSFQMYAAIKYNHPHAKMLYSEYCTYAPQTRYYDWEHARKQMYKVYLPHLKSGYIAKAKFEEITHPDGTLDWMMFYVPGPKAKGEHKAAQKKLRTNQRGSKPEQLELLDSEETETQESFDHEVENLISKLKSFGIAESKARNLVLNHRASVEAQIAAYPYREGKGQKNAAGWLVSAIEGNYTLPVAYLEEQERKSKELSAKQTQAAKSKCTLCDSNGWRRIKTPDYPSGAMKKCTHNPEIEGKYESVS